MRGGGSRLSMMTGFDMSIKQTSRGVNVFMHYGESVAVL